MRFLCRCGKGVSTNASPLPDEFSVMARLKRASGPGGECKPGVRPRRRQNALVPGLAFGLALECFPGQVEERQGTLAGMSLNRRGKDLAANALQLLTDGDLPAAEVDVVPFRARTSPRRKP